jgi:hypothetical protein
MVLGLTRRKSTRRRRDSPQPINNGICSFKVRTRIAKATGEDKQRYKLGAVRVLPTRKRDKVLLQASDGSQALCVLATGQVAAPKLVPGKMMPTKQTSGAIVELAGDRWTSSDGKTEPDQYAGESGYPSILEVLPELKGKPFALKPDLRSKELPYLLLGIDMTVLSKVAHGLGTSKLSLMVPVPIHTANGKAGSDYVTKPVLVCPATDEDKVRGVGVLMPLKPTNSMDYYMQSRQAVADAEKHLKTRRVRSAGVNR